MRIGSLELAASFETVVIKEEVLSTVNKPLFWRHILDDDCHYVPNVE